MGRKQGAAISGPMFDLIAEVRRQGISDVRIQRLMGSGAFTKLLRANIGAIDGHALERVLGLAGPPNVLQIKTGGAVSYSGIRTQTFREGISIGTWGDDMICRLARTPIDPSDEEIGVREVVFRSSESLGIGGEFDLRRVFAAGKANGLKLCMPEDAFKARLAYRSQPYEEHIRVAMEPIPGKEESPSIFRLDCTDEDGLSIDGMCGDLDRKWDDRKNLYWMFRI